MAAHGSMTNAVELPSPDEIKIPQELTLPAAVLKTGSFHLGKYCDDRMKEFQLCRNETSDPRKCLKEGAELTACGVDFFRRVKQLCRQEFEDYLWCVDVKYKDDYTGSLRNCRKPQRIFDKCALEKMEIERPPVGYFSVPRIHHTDRPKPSAPKVRDYKAEAGAYVNELPDDYPLKDDYKRYAAGYQNVWY